MEKYCSGCRSMRPLNEFTKNSQRKDGLQRLCRLCKKTADANYYLRNKEAQRERNRKSIEKNKHILSLYKKGKGCVYCSENDPCCLDFHHTIDKEYHISDLVADGRAKRMWQEIEKCVLLCANCHRKLHAGKIVLG